MSSNTAAYQRAYRERNPDYADRNYRLKLLRRRAAQLVANAHPDEWAAVVRQSPKSWTSDKKYSRLVASFRAEYELHYAALRLKEGLL